MTEILRAAAGIFAALAPFGFIPAFLALPRGNDENTIPGGKMLVSGLVATLVALLITVLITDLFLGLIDVVPESFQAGAAVIMLPLAAQLLWTGRSMEPGEKITSRPWLLPLTVPGLVGPPSLAAVLAYTARYSEAEAAAAIVLALAVTGVILAASEPIKQRLGDIPLGIIGRLSGAFIVVVALELVVDGVRSV
jgi:small neutral amino acid transporter SnatA (MarC family)